MAAKKNKFDFKTTLSPRAYTLMVFWRFKKIDQELFGSKRYRKRSVEQIQNSENTRMRMHKGAVEELTKIQGFSEEEAHKMLQEECERLANEEIRDLEKDESLCGSCRTIIKTKNWDKHQEEEKLLHDYLSDELRKLSIEQTQMQMSMIEDEREKASPIGGTN